MTDRLDITVDGVRLACQFSGSASPAPTVVLLHALGETSDSWGLVRTELDSAFRVLSIDLRGHGDSDYPGTYSFELMRDDVLGVLDQLDLQSVRLIGHSMGGVVAYLVAQSQPGRVERLILEDTPPPLPRERAAPQRPEGELTFDWAAAPAMASQLKDPDPAWWDQLIQISAPTLIIAGGPTSHIPQDRIQDLSDRIPSCTVLTIPVGHNIHQVTPAEFSAAVRNFLHG